jgi:hypothetical protein
VTLSRTILLTLGPLGLVGAVYAVSFPAPDREQKVLAFEQIEAEAEAALARGEKDHALAAACAAATRELAPTLPANCHVIIRPPFILAGDRSEAELQALYAETVLPVTRALWRSFFDRKPDKPLIIVALGNQSTYESVAADLDGYEASAYSGYTQRGQRRIVVNLETGRGTLAHELAHLLALFDFSEMPEWFDEGLAALHEEAVFADDGLTIVGRSNWRSRLLRSALERDAMPRLETVIRNPAFRGEGEGLNYAIVRAFCHYLQQRQLLSHFYRKFRDGAGTDPTGIATLCELLGVSSISEVEREFRDWVATSPEAR